MFCFVSNHYQWTTLSEMVFENPKAKVFEWQTMRAPYLNSMQNVQAVMCILILSICRMQAIPNANFKTFAFY